MDVNDRPTRLFSNHKKYADRNIILLKNVNKIEGPVTFK